jgi:hypothetical protein
MSNKNGTPRTAATAATLVCRGAASHRGFCLKAGPEFAAAAGVIPWSQKRIYLFFQHDWKLRRFRTKYVEWSS